MITSVVVVAVLLLCMVAIWWLNRGAPWSGRLRDQRRDARSIDRQGAFSSSDRSWTASRREDEKAKRHPSPRD